MKRSSLFLLIFCNLAWTFNPLMGKTLLRTYSGLQVAWIRYAGAFAAFLLVATLSVLIDRRKRLRDYFLVPTDLRIWLELFAVGIGPFVFSPILQFVGLETTQAMDNSILIATEPLITVVLAWAILGERMTRDHWISMGIAITGFFLFSGLFGRFAGEGAGFSLSFGMILLVLAQVGEGAYSVFGRKLVQVYAPTAVLGSALGIGLVLLTAIVAVFDRLPSPSTGGMSQLGAALFLGPIGSTLTYLIWAMIARTVTVPSMVITLFIQPVLGAWVGYLLLGESLTTERFAGALLILTAVAFLFYREIRRAPAPGPSR
jgi:drug/metabolite transporter (DMT)-like permease